MSPASVHSTVIRAIEEATQDVFSMMIGVDVAKEAAGAAAAGAELMEAGIRSEFTLSGAVRGMATVFYSMTLGRWITAQMLQSEPSEEQEMLDAAGEVANMIVGNVKNKVEKYVGTIQISTPAVEKLERLESATSDAGANAVSFRCRESVFTVAIAFREASPRTETAEPSTLAGSDGPQSPAASPTQNR